MLKLADTAGLTEMAEESTCCVRAHSALRDCVCESVWSWGKGANGGKFFRPSNVFVREERAYGSQKF